MQLKTPQRTTADYAALQAAVDQHREERDAEATARLKAIRENETKEQKALAALVKKAADRSRDEKRTEAEKEAEQAAEDARRAVIDRYEQETGQTAVDKAYRNLAQRLR